jgi:protein-S-isoprenylcysteine O-methyltransferase Ste14
MGSIEGRDMSSETAVLSVIAALWLAWLTYWMVSAFNVKRTQWTESLLSGALHRLPLLVACLLLATPRPWPQFLRERLLPEGIVVGIVGAVLVVAGLGFSVWARRHLGRNWSSNVVVKEGHALVRTGPYRRVRHPIYTGMLVGFLGTAVAIGEWRGVVAVALAVAAFAWKSRLEEGRMRATFPEYEQYRKETAALVPFLY